MKLAAVADVHTGNHKRFGGPAERSLNKRCRDTVAVLERAYKLAAAEGAKVMCVLGDLVDDVDPPPQLLADLLRIVREAHEVDGIYSVLIVGNHDQQSDQEGDHALAPFTELPNACVVIGDPSIMPVGPENELELVMLPHSSAAPAKARVTDLLDSIVAGTTPRVLLMHAGVADDKTAPFLKGASDSVDVETLVKAMRKGSTGLCLAGNWHDARDWDLDGTRVCQVGALVPTGFDNPGLVGYGQLVILDSADGSLRRHEIDGPRFVPVIGLKKLDELLNGPSSPPHHKLYVSAIVSPDDLKAANLLVAEAHKRGQLVAGEVLIDSAERVVAAKRAAGAARSAETMADALGGFVSAMPLEDDVPRDAVMTRCRAYLKM